MEDELVTALDRLLENDWSYECTDVIFKFRTNVAQSLATQTTPEAQKDEAGRQFVEYIGKFQLSTQLGWVNWSHPNTDTL